jgi:hypothetical protein
MKEFPKSLQADTAGGFDKEAIEKLLAQNL